MEKNIVTTKPCKKIVTKDTDGAENGWMLEVISDRDGFTSGLTGQAYISVADVGSKKGYHIHALATYHVTCIKGKVRSTIYMGFGKKNVIEFGDGDYKTIKYPPCSANLFENIGDEPAYVMIYRDISWSPDVHEQLDIAPERIDTKEAWEEIEAFCGKFKIVKPSVG